MNKLKLYRYSKEYIQLCKDHNWYDFVKDKIDTVYVCLGEFSHAPGHVLMVEFGTWKPMEGMPELYNFEELENHPDDFIFTVEDS